LDSAHTKHVPGYGVEGLLARKEEVGALHNHAHHKTRLG
jgi:hypothetical protein